MVYRSRRPGPTRTSCLTCRRRHKKCDQRQPTCERCEQGDFECLGYNHIQDELFVAQSARRILPKSSGGDGPAHLVSSGLQGSEPLFNGSLPQKERSQDLSLIPSSSKSSTSSRLHVPDKPRAPVPITSHAEGCQPPHLFCPQSAVVPGAPMSILRQVADFYTRLPHPISNSLKPRLDNQWSIDTIVARLEKVMAHWYFKPTLYQKEHFRQGATQRLQNSKFTRWVALLGTSVIESFIAGDVSRRRFHNAWIESMEGSIKRELALDLAPNEVLNRRSDWIHVSLMKTMLIHCSNIYELLRRVMPTFLQVVYSNPTLWSGDSDLTRIPLSSILTSGPNELAYFTLIDCVYSMASGLPQHVEYNTALNPRPSSSSSHQWVHSSPYEFLLVLADINACRDKSPTAHDWKDIERRLLTRQSRLSEYAFSESWMTVAWYAVQESWRLALLVYLYLAVCGASSDDPRIQSRVKQIVQIVGTVKKRGTSDAITSFFTQYLMVGICARREAHRKIARDKLMATNDTKLWLMQVYDFVPVLDHLWHGAAVDGRPVKWSDYIHSREVVLPVAL